MLGGNVKHPGNRFKRSFQNGKSKRVSVLIAENCFLMINSANRKAVNKSSIENLRELQSEGWLLVKG
jgi:hypothetical protein